MGQETQVWGLAPWQSGSFTGGSDLAPPINRADTYSSSLKKNERRSVEGSVRGKRSSVTLQVGSSSSPGFVVGFCVPCSFSDALFASLILFSSQILEDKTMWRLLFRVSSCPVQHSSARRRDSFPGISSSLKNYSFSGKEPLELSSRCGTELCPGPSELLLCSLSADLMEFFFESGERSKYDHLKL